MQCTVRRTLDITYSVRSVDGSTYSELFTMYYSVRYTVYYNRSTYSELWRIYYGVRYTVYANRSTYSKLYRIYYGVRDTVYAVKCEGYTQQVYRIRYSIFIISSHEKPKQF